MPGFSAGDVLNVAVWLAVLAGLVVVGRRIHAESALCGWLFAAGAAARLILGALAFLISYYDAPILTGLHTGRGFWVLATDAQLYFEVAAEASRSGLATISNADPSPMYLRTLALWMDIAGVSPASGILFNVICYAGTALCLLAVCRSSAGLVALAAITLSPALLIASVQPLKDPFCIFLIVSVTAGVSLWTTVLTGPDRNRLPLVLWAATLTCASVYLLAGIRAYLAVIILIALIIASVWTVATRPGGLGRAPLAGAHAALVAAVMLVAVAGAGPYLRQYSNNHLPAFGEPRRALAMLDRARTGFLDAGGATDFAGDLAPGDTSAAARFRRVALGTTVMFVPISILKALSVVRFSGGRGLLFITDVDTVIADVAIVIGLYLLVLTKADPRVRSVSIFAVVLAVLTTAAMAYVITNFGTLFRLRLLAVTPIWLVSAYAQLPKRRDELAFARPTADLGATNHAAGAEPPSAVHRGAANSFNAGR